MGEYLVTGTAGLAVFWAHAHAADLRPNGCKKQNHRRHRHSLRSHFGSSATVSFLSASLRPCLLMGPRAGPRQPRATVCRGDELVYLFEREDVFERVHRPTPLQPGRLVDQVLAVAADLGIVAQSAVDVKINGLRDVVFHLRRSGVPQGDLRVMQKQIEAIAAATDVVRHFNEVGLRSLFASARRACETPHGAPVQAAARAESKPSHVGATHPSDDKAADPSAEPGRAASTGQSAVENQQKYSAAKARHEDVAVTAVVQLSGLKQAPRKLHGDRLVQAPDCPLLAQSPLLLGPTEHPFLAPRVWHSSLGMTSCIKVLRRGLGNSSLPRVMPRSLGTTSCS